MRPDDGGDTKISINPRGSKIPANTVGFFIAGDCMEVKMIINKCQFNLVQNQPSYHPTMKRWKEPGTTARRATRMWRTKTRSRSVNVKTVSIFIIKVWQFNSLIFIYIIFLFTGSRSGFKNCGHFLSLSGSICFPVHFALLAVIGGMMVHSVLKSQQIGQHITTDGKPIPANGGV